MASICHHKKKHKTSYIFFLLLFLLMFYFYFSKEFNYIKGIIIESSFTQQIKALKERTEKALKHNP